ncbi:MAG: Unknown protein [uncultured Sulfurovum sp.]|uniref:Uncharacterized protein n=1 Tax=uncultured Sulfurovum sp. TaxID=269237 RepID=A0A6S6T4K0_9BACT|nr:MAG: Unknown protein [uncultured Sulfurovum sp.]
MKKNRVEKLEKTAKAKSDTSEYTCICMLYSHNPATTVCTCGEQERLKAIRESGRMPTILDLYHKGIANEKK